MTTQQKLAAKMLFQAVVLCWILVIFCIHWLGTKFGARPQEMHLLYKAY